MPPAQEAAPVDEPEKPYTWYWDLLKSIPEQKWGTVNSVLGWRLDPKVPSRPGSKGFLFEVFQAITPMWMKENYGGGKFRCILLENGRFKTTHDFDIEGAPKYDLTREQPVAQPSVIAANGTTDAKILGMLESQIGRLNEELSASRAQGKDNPALTEAITILSTAYKESVATLGSNAGNGGGNSTVIETIRTLKELGVIGGETRREKSLLEQLTELMTNPVIGPAILELFKPKDPLAQLAQFKSIVDLFDGLRGGGDGKAKDWRAMLAEGVVQKGPELLKEIKEIVGTTRDAAAERRAAEEARTRTLQIARGMPPAGTVQPPAAPSVMPAGPLRVVPLDGAPPAVQTEIHQEAQPAPAAAPAAAPGMSVNESDAVAAFMKRRIVEMIAENRDAEDVVDFIEDVDPTVNDYLVSYSVDMVTTFLQADPILAKATQTKGWNIFLTKAQEYIQQIRAEDAMIEANANAVPS